MTFPEERRGRAKGPTFAPGDRVQLTGQFLQSTGQIAGPEGQSKWTVQACPCESCQRGDLVATDELKDDLSYWTEEELAAMPYLRWRHVASVNLKHVGRPSGRDIY